MRDYFNILFGLLLVASGALGISLATSIWIVASLLPWMGKVETKVDL